MDEFAGLNLTVIQGDIFTGLITHVVNEKEFFIVKSEAAILLGDIQAYMENTEKVKMFWYPIMNETFIFCVENEYFRAIRLPLDDPDNIKVMIIDTGESFKFSSQNNLELIDSLYIIPEQFANIPALAKRCIYVESEDNVISKTFLLDNIYEKILTFEVTKVKEDTAYVKIWPYGSVNAEKEEKDAAVDLNETLDILDKPIFTKDEIDELYEEPLNTENALIAVQGFAAKEDDQLCQFYDPNTGACFKGSLCKLKHLPLIDEYNSRGQEEVYIHKNDVDEINLGEFCSIVITQFIQVNRFICLYVDPKYNEKLEKIQEAINDPKHCKSYKKLATEPEITQLVLLKLKDQFYRAKITDYKEGFYILWCLDLGTLKTAKTDSMYEWIIRMNDFKFLSNEFEISNIVPFKANSKRAMLCVFDYHKKHGNLRAMITATAPSIKCRLFDNDMIDIGEILVKVGFASKNEYEFSFDDFSDNPIPI